MSGSTPRPDSYGWVDKNKTRQYTLGPEIPQSNDGWETGAIPTNREFNTFANRHAAWCSYLDSHAVRSEHLMGTTAVSRLSQSSFAFNFGLGFSKTVAFDSSYIIDGVVVDLPITRLQALGYSPFVFTANKWTHWYVDKDGVSFQVVNIGTPAAPGVGQYHLGYAATNGTSVTTWTGGAAALAAQRLIIASEEVDFNGTINVAGDGIFSNAVAVGAGMTVAGTMQVDGSVNLLNRLTVGSAAGATLTLSNDGGTSLVTGSMSGASPGLALTMNAAASGHGVNVAANATSSGNCYRATIPLGSSSPGLHIENDSATAPTATFNSKVQNAPGVTMSSFRGPCLTLNAVGPFAATLVMAPMTGSLEIAGAFWFEGAGQRSPKYYDSNLVERTMWATNGGISVDSGITAGPTTIGVANDVVTRTYAFVAGNKYQITMGIEVGMGAGVAAGTALLTCTVGGVALVYSGYTLRMRDTGIGTTTERGWCKSAIFTAGVTGNLAVTLRVSPSASINYEQAFIAITGHYL